MPLYVSLVFERYKLSCFCSGGCTSDLLLHAVLSPFTSTSPPPPKLVQPRPPVNVLASPFSVFPSSTHFPNGLSSLVCVMCSAQLCVCVCVCVCHVHNVDSFSPSHICIVSLCYLDLPLPCLVFSDRNVPDFSSKPPNSYCTEQLTAELTQIR